MTPRHQDSEVRRPRIWGPQLAIANYVLSARVSPARFNDSQRTAPFILRSSHSPAKTGWRKTREVLRTRKTRFGFWVPRTAYRPKAASSCRRPPSAEPPRGMLRSARWAYLGVGACWSADAVNIRPDQVRRPCLPITGAIHEVFPAVPHARLVMKLAAATNIIHGQSPNNVSGCVRLPCTRIIVSEFTAAFGVFGCCSAGGCALALKDPTARPVCDSEDCQPEAAEDCNTR